MAYVLALLLQVVPEYMLIVGCAAELAEERVRTIDAFSPYQAVDDSYQGRIFSTRKRWRGK